MAGSLGGELEVMSGSLIFFLAKIVLKLLKSRALELNGLTNDGFPIEHPGATSDDLFSFLYIKKIFLKKKEKNNDLRILTRRANLTDEVTSSQPST